MNKRIVRRGFTVLALTAALAFAGAHPAAAQDLGLFERGLRWLSSFLAQPAAQQPAAEHGTLMKRAASAATTGGSSDPNQKTVPGDKGLGVDPNGLI